MLRFVLTVLNLLGYPGVGTCLAGHRRVGIVQIILHTAATILSISGVAIIACRAWPHRQNLVTLSDWLFDNHRALLLPLTVAILGILIFLVNWLWSATTAKPANDDQTPPPLPNQSRQ